MQVKCKCERCAAIRARPPVEPPPSTVVFDLRTPVLPVLPALGVTLVLAVLVWLVTA